MRRSSWLSSGQTLPLALGANALRVAILSLGVERWGVDFVRGPTLQQGGPVRHQGSAAHQL